MAISLFAQSNTATILGNVTDGSGASIPGVKVTITNVKTQIVRSTVTDEGGAYELPLIPVGEYAIAENIRKILVQEQEHQNDLATALGVDVPDVTQPEQRA